MVRAPLHFHGRIPVPEVAPLTYRDGVTHLELVYELSQYLKNILHPSLQSTVDQVVADAEQLLSDATAQYVDGVQEFQRIHDAFMSDVNASLIALNDGAVSGLVRDDTSLLGETLREIFVDTEKFDDLSHEIDFRVTKLTNETRDTVDTLTRHVDENLETFSDRLNDYGVRPQDFGAHGDGVTDDTDSLQSWVNYLADSDTVFSGYLPHGVYRITKRLDFSGNEYGYTIDAAPGTTILYQGEENTALWGLDTRDVTIRNIIVDAGHFTTRTQAHGVYFRRPYNVNFDTVTIRNYYNSGLILTGDWDDYDHGYLHINNVHVDGMLEGRNGILVANLHGIQGANNTAINGGVDERHSPSYGIQFKNQTSDSQLVNGYSDGWKSAYACGSDTAGMGPTGVFMSGIGTDSHRGFSAGETKAGSFDFIFRRIRDFAARFQNNSSGNTLEATLHDMTTDMTPLIHSASNNTIRVRNTLNVGNDTLVRIDSGRRQNMIIIDHVEDSLTNSSMGHIDDDSGHGNNRMISMSQLAQLNTSNADGNAYLRFGGPAKYNSFFNVTVRNGTMEYRGDGQRRLVVHQNYVGPGNDNTQSAGSSSRRYAQLFARSGSINTSDEREKTSIEPISDTVLDAWKNVEFMSYQWKDGCRTHFGVVAQHVKHVFEQYGLDPFEYGVLCYDEFTDDHGHTQSRYGVRYDEAMVVESAMIRREIGL